MQQSLKQFENETIRFAPSRGGQIAAHLTHEGATAEVYLFGAHATSFVPAGAEEVLFVSDHAVFDAATPIRGGVPVCFPQFADRLTPGTDRALPKHGFVRDRNWRVQSTAPGRVVMETSESDQTLHLWPHAFNATLSVSIGAAQMRIELAVTNTGMAAFRYADALHSYLAVSDVRELEVLDLTGQYLDQLTGTIQPGTSPARLGHETDRIYHGNTTNVRLRDSLRTLTVEKHGSRSTVLWNPWVEKAARLSDLGDEEWTQFICVEAGNIDDDALTLEPGKTHTTATVFRV